MQSSKSRFILEAAQENSVESTASPQRRPSRYSRHEYSKSKLNNIHLNFTSAEPVEEESFANLKRVEDRGIGASGYADDYENYYDIISSSDNSNNYTGSTVGRTTQRESAHSHQRKMSSSQHHRRMQSSQLAGRAGSVKTGTTATAVDDFYYNPSNASKRTSFGKHNFDDSFSQHASRPPLSRLATTKTTTSFDSEPPTQVLPLPQEETPDQPAPWWSLLLHDSLACRCYVLVVLIETVVDISLEGLLYTDINRADFPDSDHSKGKMAVYLSMIAMAHVFQLGMAINAVYARNTLQFICLTVFNALLLLYTCIEITEIRGALGPVASGQIQAITTVMPIIIALAQIAYLGLGWKIYREFGWSLYKALGADRRVAKMFTRLQIFQCLLRFNVFFWLGFSVQFLVLALAQHDAEFYLTCIALPLSLMFLYLGHWAAVNEKKYFMGGFAIGCTAGLIYFFYKFIRVLQYKDATDDAVKSTYLHIWKTLTVFSVCSIVLLIITMVTSFIVYQNFDKGLKDALQKRAGTHSRTNSLALHGRQMSHPMNRMSIE